MPHPLDESALIDLVHGLASPSERDSLLAHLRTCEQCEGRFRALVREHELLRAEKLPGLAGASMAGPSSTVRPKLVVWAAVAAAAVLIGFIAIPRLAGDRTSSVYWIPIEHEATVLRSTNEAPTRSEVNGALDAYVNRDAAGAIEELRAFQVSPDNETSSDLRDLFLASALVNAGQHGEANDLLDRLDVDTLPTQWRGQARWVRYIALARLERRDEARALLDKLVREPGEIGRLAREAAGRNR